MTLNHQFILWRQLIKGNTLYSWLLHIIPCFIIWEIWKARNRYRFDDKSMSADAIIEELKCKLSDIYLAHKLKLQRGPLLEKFTIFSVLVAKLHHIAIPVEWVPLDAPLAKLNSDDASKGNPGIAGAGGLLRDSNCHFLLGYSCSIGIRISLFVETCVVLVGIKEALQHGILHLWIEMDSTVLVDIIQAKTDIT